MNCEHGEAVKFCAPHSLKCRKSKKKPYCPLWEMGWSYLTPACISKGFCNEMMGNTVAMLSICYQKKQDFHIYSKYTVKFCEVLWSSVFYCFCKQTEGPSCSCADWPYICHIGISSCLELFMNYKQLYSQFHIFRGSKLIRQTDIIFKYKDCF